MEPYLFTDFLYSCASKLLAVIGATRMIFCGAICTSITLINGPVLFLNRKIKKYIYPLSQTSDFCDLKFVSRKMMFWVLVTLLAHKSSAKLSIEMCCLPEISACLHIACLFKEIICDILRVLEIFLFSTNLSKKSQIITFFRTEE
jgi:hypothetical protein